MNNTLTPYQEWIVLRNLVKENNKRIRFYVLRSNGTDVDTLPEAYKILGQNFFERDKESNLIYEDKCKKNWIDSLSVNDLFSYFNFQNKILTTLGNNFSLNLLDMVSFNISTLHMNFFKPEVEFSGKPKKQENDFNTFDETWDENIVKVLLKNYKSSCLYYEEKNDTKLNFEPIGNLSGFDFGGYNGVIKSKIFEERENQRKKEESEKIKKDETPYFPGFEEMIKNCERKSFYMYDEELIK